MAALFVVLIAVCAAAVLWWVTGPVVATTAAVAATVAALVAGVFRRRRSSGVPAQLPLFELRPVRSRRVRTAAGFALPLVVAVVFSAAAALFVAPNVSVSGPVLFGEVSVSGSAPAGVTRVAVPPAGSVSAQTHSGPYGVAVRLDAVDVERVEQVSGAPVPQAQAAVEDLARDWAVRVVLASVVLSLLVAAVVVAVTPRRRSAAVAVVAVFTGVAVSSLSLLSAVSSFDPQAFEQPRFDGALVHAPQVLEAVTRLSEGELGSISAAVEQVTGYMEVLAAPSAFASESDSDVVVLHVSDLHMNPLGAQFTVDLANRFDVDAVVDTGDFTSFGWSNVEAVFAELVDLEVPYYLVPGNHDSVEVVERIAAESNVVVVDGNVVDIEGLSLLGVADPTFTPAGGDVDLEARDELYAGQLPDVERLVRLHRPDVIGLHNPIQATAVLDAVEASRRPFDVSVLSGHIHRPHFERVGSVSLAVAGSTGADGVGRFFGGDDLGVYEAQVLRFAESGTGFVLSSVDRIEVSGDALLGTAPGRFTLQRLLPSAEETTGPRYLLSRQAAYEDPLTVATAPGGDVPVWVSKEAVSRTLHATAVDTSAEVGVPSELVEDPEAATEPPGS